MFLDISTETRDCILRYYKKYPTISYENLAIIINSTDSGVTVSVSEVLAIIEAWIYDNECKLTQKSKEKIAQEPKKKVKRPKCTPKAKRTCVKCGTDITHRGVRSTRCESCQREYKKAWSRKYHYDYYHKKGYQYQHDYYKHYNSK